jgi:ABC-type multidrug transport system fused ATPase/permease subunit
VLVWMNPRLALLALLVLPLLIYRGLHYGRLARPLSAIIQNQMGTLTSRLEQSLRGTRAVKAFAQETAEIRRFDRENETWFELSARASRLEAVNTPLLDLIANAGSVLILLYGGWLAIAGQITLGQLVAFMTYLTQLASPVRMLGRIIPAVAMAGAAGERIFAILDADPEVNDEPGAISLPTLHGHVRFEDVTLAYGGRRPAVRNITFEARPG